MKPREQSRFEAHRAAQRACAKHGIKCRAQITGPKGGPKANIDKAQRAANKAYIDIEGHRPRPQRPGSTLEIRDCKRKRVGCFGNVSQAESKKGREYRYDEKSAPSSGTPPPRLACRPIPGDFFSFGARSELD